MKKKVLTMLFTAALFCLSATAAFAVTDYPYITMDDSEDFTLVKNINGTESVKVVGLDEFWSKVDFTGDEDDYLTWTTSNSNVAKFVVGGNEVTSTSGSDTVTVKALAEGNATITITYDTPTADPVSVTSYLVVEGSTTTYTVTGIDFSLDGDQVTDFSYTNLTVPLFDLNEVFGGNFDDADVLKKTPTALHALLYALELHFDDDNSDWDDENWDWDWVPGNVGINDAVSSQGSYLEYIGGDINDYSYGWQYKLNNVDPGHAGSVTPLSNNDDVDWGFWAFSW